ncbi:hypothetical protein ECCB7326_1910, partial [Escherichia coli CB7326]
MRKIPE